MAYFTLVHELIEIEYELRRAADWCGIKPVLRERYNRRAGGTGNYFFTGCSFGSVYEQHAAAKHSQYDMRIVASSHGERRSAVLILVSVQL